MTSYAEIKDLVTADKLEAQEQTLSVISALRNIGKKLKAVVAIYEEDALNMAQNLKPDAPLSGVPLAHKELFRRKGWLDEGGSASFVGRIATETATVISQLDEAGAIDCARLTSVEYAFGVTGHNNYAGTPQNPWNRDYICGGSSSGSAAVVAAGIVPAALGSDTGGSIRLPAAACGLVGIKPTQGLVSRAGVFPLAPSLDCVGPLARSVRDAALILETIRGYDSLDSESSIEAPATPLLKRVDAGIKGLRFGRAEEYFLKGSDSEVADATEATFADIESLGGAIVDTQIEGIEDTNPINVLLIATEAAHNYKEVVLEHHQVMNEQTVMRILMGCFTTAEEHQQILSIRANVARRMIAELFADIDILVTPVWPFLLPTIAESDVGAKPAAASLVQRIGHNTRPFNFLGLPALTLPTGWDENGLPMAIQLVGKPFDEATLIQAATALEKHYAFWDKKPAL